ncbi:uncharacterized protein V1510DRAFT_406544 [Dipodascopsis tothii]|uniref:uncharacterized protein n=1 Tax=Dipodascopsis tothii TaxID=44089 RepID=UPI0034CD52D6
MAVSPYEKQMGKLEIIICQDGDGGFNPRRKAKCSCLNCRAKKLNCKSRYLTCEYRDAAEKATEPPADTPTDVDRLDALSSSPTGTVATMYSVSSVDSRMDALSPSFFGRFDDTASVSTFESMSSCVMPSPSLSSDSGSFAEPGVEADLMLSPEFVNLSAVPASHNLTAAKLLQWPAVSKLLPPEYHCEDDIIMYTGPNRAEVDEDVPVLLSPNEPNALDRVFDLNIHKPLLRSFLKRAYASYPIIDISRIERMFFTARLIRKYSHLDGALMAIILAIGAETRTLDVRGLAPGEDLRSIQAGLYKVASSLMTSVTRKLSLKTVQYCIYMSLYELMRLRPLDCYRHIQHAWSNLQVLLRMQKGAALSSVDYDLNLRCYWCLFVLDSELRAEFQLTPMGIESFESTTDLPKGQCESSETLELYGGIVIWYYFNAHIAIRRLLNRVHSTLYTQEPDEALMKPGLLLATTHELEYQLETWRSNLPPMLYFEKDELAEFRCDDADDPVRRATTYCRFFLFQKYRAARIVINRFYLYFVLHFAKSSQEDPLILDRYREKAVQCVNDETVSILPISPKDTEYLLGQYCPSTFSLPSVFVHAVALIACYIASDKLPVNKTAIEEQLSFTLRIINSSLAPWFGLAAELSELVNSMIRSIATVAFDDVLA